MLSSSLMAGAIMLPVPTTLTNTSVLRNAVESHRVLHPLQHEHCRRRTSSAFVRNAGEFVTLGEAIVELGVPRQEPAAGNVEEFR